MAECPTNLDELINQVANHPQYHNLPEGMQWGFSMGVVFNQKHLHKPRHRENVKYAKDVWHQLYDSD